MSVCRTEALFSSSAASDAATDSGEDLVHTDETELFPLVNATRGHVRRSRYIFVLAFVAVPAVVVVILRWASPQTYEGAFGGRIELSTISTAPSAKVSPRRDESCSRSFQRPPRPEKVDEHNGIKLQDVCLAGEGPFHAFIIGDWGSILEGHWHHAANNIANRMRRFVDGVDTNPQDRVRDQMRKRAPHSKPDYFLNVGDSFYWGGIDGPCGSLDFTTKWSSQFWKLYNTFYTGEGIDGKPWLGVLGNHDWGGWCFHNAWDRIIGYTWNPHSQDRWFIPALYWAQTVHYPDFSVDYYFLDTNVWDAYDFDNPSQHNICSKYKNPWNSECPAGLTSVWRCPSWFKELWESQKKWLAALVQDSTADWRIVVTHFPPYFPEWLNEVKEWTKELEIDLFVTGHRHEQHTHGVGDPKTLIWPSGGPGPWKHLYTDFLDPSSWVVSGGGGGVTSEMLPHWSGQDDQYGFMDMTLTKDALLIEAISHGGILRRNITVRHQYCHRAPNATHLGPSNGSISYHDLPTGTDSCPNDAVITTLCECQDAVAALADRRSLPEVLAVEVGAFHDKPLWCSIRFDDNFTQPYFNTGHEGNYSDELCPVCRNSTNT